MSLLISLIVALVVVGIVYAIIQLIPLPAPFKQIGLAVCLLVLLIWVLGIATGNIHGIVW